MKVGFGFYWGDMPPDDFAAVVRRGEELGYDFTSIWDHLVYPKDVADPSLYGPGRMAQFADPRTLDPLVALGYLAARTTRIRLRTNIYILPLRNPFVAARAALTVDALSGGRLDFGIGAGWLEEEFRLAGQDFSSRGRRMDEMIQILKLLSTEDEPEFHGRYYDFGPVRFEPKPIQKPHPPIHVGGESMAALRRAAQYGDGWLRGGTHYDVAAARQAVATLRALLREYGRERAPFDIHIGSFGWVDLSTLRAYEDAGVTSIRVSPWAGDISGDLARSGAGPALRQGGALPSTRQRAIEGLERYADTVLAKLR